MINLGVGADLFGAFIWLVRLLILGLIALALWQGKTWKRKLIYVGLILLVVSAPLVPGRIQQWEYQHKYKLAKAVFDERCKTAGEKIYRTVENVEGVLLLNVRSRASNADRHDPNWPNAGLPNEHGGDGYIRSFLYWEHQQRAPARGYLNGSPKGGHDWYATFPGYSYVDAKEEIGVIYRYRLEPRPSIDLSRELLRVSSARYAVSFRNIVDPTDRMHWVAGTAVSITDTSTQEVIAEKTWYSFEPGLGSSAGARMPWAFARTCPEIEGATGGTTRMFVDQVLKPKKGV